MKTGQTIKAAGTGGRVPAVLQQHYQDGRPWEWNQGSY
jgi:hypothetical protein